MQLLLGGHANHALLSQHAPCTLLQLGRWVERGKEDEAKQEASSAPPPTLPAGVPHQHTHASNR